MNFVECSQSGQSERMVTTQGYEFWMGERGGEGTAVAQLEEGSRHLRQSHGVVQRCHGDVAAVEDRRPAGVGIHARAGVEAAETGLPC